MNKEMVDIERDLESICDLKNKIVCVTEKAMESDMQNIDTKELGYAFDMIKDMYEAKCKCYEALYYKTVTEAMLESHDEKYGYNPNHYASSGRFASKGHGKRMGFDKTIPVEYMNYYLDDPDKFEHEMRESLRMGYDGNIGGRYGVKMDPNGYTPMWMNDSDWDDRYGRAYNKYKTSRRYYTESHSTKDKSEMDAHAEEHINDTVSTLKDIYKNSDTELKKKLKEHVSKLLSEMT